MSKLLRILFTLTVFLMMVGGVQAETQKQIWQNASGEGLSGFQVALKQNGYDVTELDIKAKDLGLAAYDVALKNHLLDLVEPEFRTPEAYAKHFLKFAFGKKVPERITWAFFKRKGQGRVGWRLPVDDKYGKQLQAMENKFIQAMLAQNEDIKTGLKEEVSRLSAVDEEHDAAIKALGESVEKYRNGTLTQQDLAVFDGKVTQFASRVGNLESTVGTQGFQIQSLALGVVVIGMLMVIGGRVQDKRTKAVEVRTKALENDVMILKGERSKDNLGLVQESTRRDELLYRLTTELVGLPEIIGRGMKVSPDKIDWNANNVDQNRLGMLPRGVENSVAWQCKFKGNNYSVELWRENKTPEGFLCTLLTANPDGQYCCDREVSIKHLKLEIACLISEGLLKPTTMAPPVQLARSM